MSLIIPPVTKGRFVAGYCIGLTSLSLPVYLAEILEPAVRGRLGLLPTSLGNCGVLAAYVAGAGLDWANLSLVAALLPIPFMVILIQLVSVLKD